jgi:hypothetical protein
MSTPEIGQPSTDEWVKALTPQQCEEIIAKELEARNFHGVKAMLTVLAAKDPDRAQAVLDTIYLGFEVSRRRDALERQ